MTSTAHVAAAPGSFNRLPRLPDSYRELIIGGWLIVGALVAGFVAWGSLAPLNSAALAPGTVVVNSNRQIIQHLEGGIIKSIAVRDGTVVEQDQPLLTLDGAQGQALLRLLEGRYDLGRAEQARFMAERAGAEALTFPDDMIEKAKTNEDTALLLSGQRNLFEAREKMLAGQTSIYENRIEQSGIQIQGFHLQQAAKERQNALYKRELAGLQSLAKQGYAPANKVLQFQREIEQLEAELGTIQSNIAAVQQEIGEARLQIMQIKKNFIENVENSLRDNQTQVFDLHQQMLAAQDQVSRLIVRAPVSGTVVDLAVHTVGGVIPPGQKIMEIVPNNDHLVVEAQMKPTDIEGIVPGRPAEIRLGTLSGYTTAPLSGKVIYVSADRLTDARTSAAHYTVRVETNHYDSVHLKDVQLLPGMPVEVMIDKGSRTFFEYLFGPIGRVLNNALRD